MLPSYVQLFNAISLLFCHCIMYPSSRITMIQLWFPTLFTSCHDIPKQHRKTSSVCSVFLKIQISMSFQVQWCYIYESAVLGKRNLKCPTQRRRVISLTVKDLYSRVLSHRLLFNYRNHFSSVYKIYINPAISSFIFYWTLSCWNESYSKQFQRGFD